MRFSKWIVVAIFTLLICNSGHLFAQEKKSTKPPVKTRSKDAAKPKPGSPLVKPEHQRDRIRRTVAWFDSHLR